MIEEASRNMAKAGARRHCVNCGGDIQLGPDPSPWRIGIAHPARPGALCTVVTGHGLATAVDAFATAAFAMGDAARGWVEETDDLEAFAVTASGGTWRTSGF